MTLRSRLRNVRDRFYVARATTPRHLVLDRRILPANLPVAATAIAWLFYEVHRPAKWVWIAGLAVLTLWWIGSIVRVIATEVPVDIFASVRNKQVRRDVWRRSTDREPEPAASGSGSVEAPQPGSGPVQPGPAA